ncbi:hypothetical protein GCM10007082_21730 [Oceanisphaera arctica]|nr:hypothetical protein GCM10007082_21730 [Oceanisphaera arctica]
MQATRSLTVLRYKLCIPAYTGMTREGALCYRLSAGASRGVSKPILPGFSLWPAHQNWLPLHYVDAP